MTAGGGDIHRPLSHPYTQPHPIPPCPPKNKWQTPRCVSHKKTNTRIRGRPQQRMLTRSGDGDEESWLKVSELEEISPRPSAESAPMSRHSSLHLQNTPYQPFLKVLSTYTAKWPRSVFLFVDFLTFNPDNGFHFSSEIFIKNKNCGRGGAEEGVWEGPMSKRCWVCQGCHWRCRRSHIVW